MSGDVNVLGEIESHGTWQWWVKTHCYNAISGSGVSLEEADRRANEAATPGPLPFSRQEGYRWRDEASKKTSP